jgi:ABC-2 type transport system permease protein
MSDSRPNHSDSVATSNAEMAGFPGLISPEIEARAFWRLRGCLAKTMLTQLLSRARFRVSATLLASGLLWLVLFWLFIDGFRFLDSAMFSPDLQDRTIRALFGLFFMALTVMLIFSSAIILYGSLFRSSDIPFLLTLPVRPERIFVHKFQEAVVLSSWAFLLLASPMLVAYGIKQSAPWYYFVLILPLLVSFTYIPAAVGAIGCVAIVRMIPGRKSTVLLVCLALITIVVLLAGRSLIHGARGELLTPTWFQEMLNRLRITEHRWMPSWWLSSGLLSAAARELADSVLFLGLLISNALFFRQLGIGIAARIYRSAYSRLRGRRGGRKRTRTSAIDRILIRAMWRFPVEMRLLVIKDLRLFRRDPIQWSQFLIFFALLLFYFVNIRRFSYDMFSPSWVNLVSFLNVSVVGLLLATFTTRFTFPMISLEGRRFWVLGLLPVRRETILWSKFILAVGGAAVPCSILILLSDLMLRVPAIFVVSHQVTCLVLCFGLSGIAVGLGATMPNLREESPSKIAAGFGGTLNLVISTIYILAVVLMTAVPCHFYMGTRHSLAANLLADWFKLTGWLQFWMVAGFVGSVLIGILATVMPMRVGFRAFRRLEF